MEQVRSVRSSEEPSPDLLSPARHSSTESIQLPTPSRPLERFRAAKSGIQAIFERILWTLEDTRVLLIRRPVWVLCMST